jgi:hypothetical protein
MPGVPWTLVAQTQWDVIALFAGLWMLLASIVGLVVAQMIPHEAKGSACERPERPAAGGLPPAESIGSHKSN